MDPNRFDAITKAPVSQTNRRRTLSLVLGGALGLLGWAESEAGKSGKCKPACHECQYCKKGTCKKKNGKKTCKPGQVQAPGRRGVVLHANGWDMSKRNLHLSGGLDQLRRRVPQPQDR